MMRFWIISLLLICAAFAGNLPDEYATAKEVAEWTERGDTVVVAFATLHCRYCQVFGEELPMYRDALNDIARVHKIDIHDKENTKFVENFVINGVPTIYVLNGKEDGVLYEGSRNPEDLAKFVKNLKSYKSEVLKDADDFENFKLETPSLLVVVQDTEQINPVVEMAGKESNHIAYISVDLAKELGLPENQALHMFRKDGSYSAKDIPATYPELKKWIKYAKLSAVSNFPEDAANIFQSGVHDVLFIIEKAATKISSEEWVTTLAESERGSVVFAAMDSQNDNAANGISFFDYKESEGSPAIRFYNYQSDKQYWYDKTIDKESLTAWIDDIKNNNVKPHMKTQELSEDWDATPVKELVGSNFREVALNEKKNVFVFIHAPWCGHCKNLSPIWKELAEMFSESDQVVFAKIDATANDIDDDFHGINGYPTLRLYKAGDNSVNEYSGSRTLDELRKFVESETDAKAEHDEADSQEKVSKEEL